MSQVPPTPPPKPTPPPASKPPAGGTPDAGGASAPEKSSGTKDAFGSPGSKVAKDVKNAGKEAQKAKQGPPPPKISDAAKGGQDASKKAPAFDKDKKPKSNLPEEPKSSKDVLKDQKSNRSDKPADSGKKPDAGKTGNQDGKPDAPQKSAGEARRDAAKDAAKQQAGQGAEMAIDGAAGAGTTKDLKTLVAKEDKNGDKVGAEERGIAAAKNVGRAANIIWGGRNEAINTGIDKVGDGLLAASRLKKRKKREMKEAASGKAMMDAATAPEVRDNMKKKRGDGVASDLSNKKKDKKSGGDKGGTQSGSGNAGGMGVGGKAAIGIGALGVVIVLIATFIFGGGQITPHDGQPSEESDEKVMDYVPGGEEGWYEVAKWSVKNQEWNRSPKQVPWTLIMGLAAEQTDLGRYSPYDAVDRDPDRESEQIITGDGGGGGNNGGGSDDVNIGNTGDMDRSNPAWRQQVAMEGLISSGYTPEQAAGIVGNMITESGVEPTKAEIGKPFPSDWGWGLVQWTFSRNTDIVSKVKDDLGAKFYTNDPSKLNDDEWVELMELELSHVIWELDNTHKHAGDPLRNASTAAEASGIFLEKFEVPADIPGNRPVRAAQAEEVLRIYEQGGVDALDNGNVAVNMTREEAEWLTFNTDDQVRTEMTGTSDCAVANPDPEIGGGEGEGVGPYLLTEGAAADARADGYDPQSPCVGRWIASQLADSTGDVNADGEFTYHDDAPWPYGEGNGPGGDGDGGGDGGGNAGTGESGSVQYPVSRDIPMTSPFGPRRHPVTGEFKDHNGTDFGAPGGTEIGAVADGVVKENTSKTTGWGNYVRITHQVNGEEVESLYAHMREQSSLKVGDEISAGDTVGKVGTTGSSTGDHLHLEIRIGGELTDPAPWLEENAGGGNTSTPAESDAQGGNTANNLQDPVDSRPVSGNDDDEEEEGEGSDSDEEDENLSEEEQKKKDFEDNVKYWEAVVAGTGLFADRNASGESCELSGGANDESADAYSQQIIYSFHCEIAKESELGLIMNAAYSTPPAGATEEEKEDFEAEAVFDEIGDRYDAEMQAIQEALQVSYTATEWKLEDCTTDGEAARVGLFMLTEDEMKDAGYKPDERCDSAKSAAAAAKLFIEGEKVALDDRPDDDGVFQPALGGWDNISVAVGTEDRDDFVALGSGSNSVEVSQECYAKMEDWVTHVAKDDKGDDEGESGFSDWADMDDLDESEQRAKIRKGYEWSDDRQGGGFVGIGSKNPPHLLDDCPGGAAGDYAEQLGEIASSQAQSEGNDRKKNALIGYANWTSWVNTAGGGEPIIGKSSLVERLSVYKYDYPEIPLGSDNLSLMILNEIGGREGFVPIQQRSVEYAIFFGGLSQPFDTAEKIYGSLQEASSNGGGGGDGDGGNTGGGPGDVDAEGCPTEPGSHEGAMEGGSEEVGINELCKRSIEEARSPEAAVALKWAFQQVGVQMYSQPKRMEEKFSDCSSLISRAYQDAAGLRLYEPGGNAWVTSTFAQGGDRGAPQVDQKDLKPGDWFMPSTGHIVFVIADGYVLHASKPGVPIKIGKFYTGDYNRGGSIDPDYFDKLDNHGKDGGSDDKKDSDGE